MSGLIQARCNWKRVPTRCARVLSRSNAGKFTASGDVVVTVSIVRKAALAARTVSTTTPNANAKHWHTRLLQKVSLNRLVARSSQKVSAVDVDPNAGFTVKVESPSRQLMYLCVTVSNPRAGLIMPNPDDCFIPFKHKGGGTRFTFGRVLLVHNLVLLFMLRFLMGVSNVQSQLWVLTIVLGMNSRILRPLPILNVQLVRGSRFEPRRGR